MNATQSLSATSSPAHYHNNLNTQQPPPLSPMELAASCQSNLLFSHHQSLPPNSLAAAAMTSSHGIPSGGASNTTTTTGGVGGAIRNSNNSNDNNAMMYSISANYPTRPQHEQNQLLAQQQQHQQYQQNLPQHPHPQIMNQSPKFHSRSSPIAIIHNPEDAANQAKLRWQHPMYDTSDDELDDDDFFLSERSNNNSMNSPHSQQEAAHQSMPSTSRLSAGLGSKSLPTALLRAPKLGSLPSTQEYLLHHLASLPPPMCLNGDISLPDSPSTLHPLSSVSASGNNTTNNGATAGSSRKSSSDRPPKYFSSYGSLRESHLTGRFGGNGGSAARSKYTYAAQPGPTAASTGHLNENRNIKVRFHSDENGKEPPPTLLIPPRKPVQLATTNLRQPSEQEQKHSDAEPPKKPSPLAEPQKPMSIRDRMMQKAQQTQSQSDSNSSGSNSDSKPAASSLAAMLEATDLNGSPTITNGGESNYYKDSSQQQELQPPPEKDFGLFTLSSSASMAQAVAISYNSNKNLFARQSPYHQQQQQQQGAEGEEMLSTSMTGLEILRAASKALPARPTSLSILQDAPRQAFALRPPPPKSTTMGYASHNGATSNLPQQYGNYHQHQHPPPHAPLSRTMSEPSPHWEEEQQLQARPRLFDQPHSTVHAAPQLGGGMQGNHAPLLSSVLPSAAAQTAATTALAAASSQQPSALTGLSSMMAQEQQPIIGLSSLRTSGNTAYTGTEVDGSLQAYGNGGLALYNTNATASAAEEPNPETEGAFDMDME